MSNWFDIESLNISDHQREQLTIATSGRVGCLTGAAGCGKTWVIGEILKQYRGSSIVLTPTGKAASRVREIFPLASAATIHSALEPTRAGRDGQGWAFARNRSMPLTYDLIICDEFSMASADITSDLLNAVTSKTRLLFVGDPFRQLAPVGVGKPFIDMINAGIPHGSLTEVHRYAGRAATVCNQIANGENWKASTKLEMGLESPENLIHIESKSGAIPGNLKSFVTQFIDKGYNLDDIQILTPCNTSGDLSRERLNVLLQGWFNPDGEEIVGAKDGQAGSNKGNVVSDKNRFRIGDRCICLSNQGSQKVPADGQSLKEAGGAYVANGDTGRIVGFGVYEKKEFVKCRMPVGLVMYELSDFRKDFALAYAITGHKSQGSQWPIVIVVIDDSHGAKMVADRSWYYTACTRLSVAGCLVGPRHVMLDHCRTARIQNRRTFLASEIKRMRIAG